MLTPSSDMTLAVSPPGMAATRRLRAPDDERIEVGRQKSGNARVGCCEYFLVGSALDRGVRDRELVGTWERGKRRGRAPGHRLETLSNGRVRTPRDPLRLSFGVQQVQIPVNSAALFFWL